MQSKPLLFAVTENDVAQFGHPPLQAFEMLAVVAQLDQVVGSCGQAQLGIDDLVAVAAESRRCGDAAQKVGVSDECAVEEGGLIDDRRTGLHRLERTPLRLPKRLDSSLRPLELGDFAAVEPPEPVEMRALVLVALASEQLRVGILRIGARDRSAGDEDLELG